MNLKFLCVTTACLIASLSLPAIGDDELPNIVSTVVDQGRSKVLSNMDFRFPDWVERVEFDLKFTEDLEPTGQILTVQPLYQSPDKDHTFFTQLSYLSYEQFDDTKNTTNVGLGYRHVTMDNSLLLGANVFYDYEWDEGHERIGYGVEAKKAMLDFTANYYDAISNNQDISDSVTERALDGYDIELRSQLPYMPWARVGATYFKWDGVDYDDVEGVKASIDADLTPNMGVEFGFIEDDDDTQDTQLFANVSFNLGSGDSRALGGNAGTMFGDGFSDQAFVKRDMRDQTLTKVRRQNKIITERNSSGVTISRAN